MTRRVDWLLLLGDAESPSSFLLLLQLLFELHPIHQRANGASVVRAA